MANETPTKYLVHVERQLQGMERTPSRDLAISLTNAARQAVERALMLPPVDRNAELKNIADRLEALETYFRKQGADLVAGNLIFEERIRTLGLWGLEYEALEEERAIRGKNRSSTTVDDLTLKQEALRRSGGISRELARRFVMLGRHLDDLEEWFEEVRETTELSVAKALRTLSSFDDEDSGQSWLRVYNIWSFAYLDARFGSGHPGNIPGQVNMNLNYYYTQPGDLVVDLFAGGGTTLDVCNYDDDAFGNRVCLAYDINPTRADIQRWDVVKNGLPDFPYARLVFLDPPYWKQKRGGYGDEPTNLANMELDDFNAALEKIIKDSLQRADLVALIIGATQHGHDFVDHASEFVRRVGPPIQRIIVPYTTQQYGGAHVQRAKSGRYMLNIYRDLLIWGRL